jgi:hypothetical protein
MSVPVVMLRYLDSKRYSFADINVDEYWTLKPSILISNNKLALLPQFRPYMYYITVSQSDQVL